MCENCTFNMVDAILTCMLGETPKPPLIVGWAIWMFVYFELYFGGDPQTPFALLTGLDVCHF